jgi:hypothetical protein
VWPGLTPRPRNGEEPPFEVGDRLYEAHALFFMAALQRRCGGPPAKCEHLLEQAEAVFRQVGVAAMLARCLCERGHGLLAQGRFIPELLAQVREQAAAQGTGVDREHLEAVARLERAAEAFERGLPLLRGECAEDLSEELRQWQLASEKAKPAL